MDNSILVKMRPKQIKIEDILEMFKEQKVMTLSALSGKAKCSGKTILRRLKEHGYYTSYNMNGKYYTIPEIAAFDECGFWKYDDVYFNKFGGLREIMKRMIESSEMGYTVDELNKKLNVNCGSHVMTFVREGIIARRKYGGFYVYFSTDKKKQNSQAGKKEQHIRANEIPELDEYLSIRNINEKLIINVLTEFINNRKATPEEVKDILKNKNILTKKEIVDEIFRRYDLFKKKDTIEVLQEVLNLEANLKENFNFRENMGTPQIEFRSENTSCDVCGRKNHVLKTEKRNVTSCKEIKLSKRKF